MQGRGVIIASDVQEKRLWTLMTSLYRCGVTNAVVIRKVGQWFAKHMTERFDRVLCDAPCTAQGTSRKDSDALTYCSLENIEKMARLQYQMLESAIHSAKVGGRIVFSTCTLTPEENEGVVRQILNKFCDQLEVVDPRSIAGIGNRESDIGRAIDDSDVVQRSLFPKSESRFPFVRLWPQTYDTEGFFCAVLRKTARTKDPEPMDWVPFFEEDVPSGRTKDIGRILSEQFGTPFIRDGECLYQRKEQLLITTDAVAKFGLPVLDFGVGLPFAKRLTDGRIRVSHEMATLRGTEATQNTLTVSDEERKQLLTGQDIACDPVLYGDQLLMAEGLCIGRGLAKEGKLKNNLPREMIR
jgi:16S rRNA (cytosine1407-C5)-methyltransferase